jgi:hypothetical protein
MNARNYPKREIVAAATDLSTRHLVDVLSCGHVVFHRSDYKGAQGAERRACASCCVAKFSRQIARFA